MKYLVACILFCTPQIVCGAVTISEVAWMGTEASANDEWIELYNDGSAVDVTGWKLSDGMNLEVLLSGTIDANTYAVLERTDDGTAPPAAFMIYTGALGNTGATLTLLRSDGAIEDQVAGGDNWASIGGDNTTKETAQLTQSGWVTATPTPGKENTTSTQGGGTTNTSTTSAGVSVQKDSTKNERIELKRSDAELALTLDGPDQVYVNQEVTYRVRGNGVGDTILNSVVYSWSFGDMDSGSGKEVSHTYSYSGEYVVTVEGVFGRHAQVARKNVTVLPLQFVLTRNELGDILLHNNAKYEVDISGYTLRGSKVRTFPRNSIMLAGATLTLKKSVVGDNPPSVSLHDQTGLRVARLGYVAIQEANDPGLHKTVKNEFLSTHFVEEASVAEVSEQIPVERNFSFESDVVEVEQISSDDMVPEQETDTVPTEQHTPSTSTRTLPYMLLSVVLMGGVGALLYGGRNEESQLV